MTKETILGTVKKSEDKAKLANAADLKIKTELEAKAKLEAEAKAKTLAEEKAATEADFKAKAEAKRVLAEEEAIEAELKAEAEAKKSVTKAIKVADKEAAKKASKIKKITSSELEITSTVDLKFGKDLWIHKNQSIFLTGEVFKSLLVKLPNLKNFLDKGIVKIVK